MCIFSGITDSEETGELVFLGSAYEPFHVLRLVADGNPERARQPLSRRRQQDIFDRRPRRGEIVERTLIRRPAQRAILLPEKRQYEAVALDEHPPLFGQSIDEHGAFVLIHRFGRLQPCLLDISGIFRYRRYEPCDVLPPAHDNELELPQMVVGRSLESRRQNFFQHFVRDDFIGKVTNGPSSLQYLIKFHDNKYF